MGPRRLPTGLRPRLATALAATSALTLVVAAVALLSPLEAQLRAERLDALASAVAAARPGLESLPAEVVSARGARLARLARRLRRRTGADIAIFTPTGRVLVNTDPEAGGGGPAAGTRLPEYLRAQRSGRAARGIGRAEGDREARVALPVHSRAGSLLLLARRPLTETQPAVRVVERALVKGALIALALATLLGVFIATRLIRRLRMLRDTALRVSELGLDVDVRADAARDEVGDLTRALATMQGRLREQEQARRAFVSTASHELRTPLTSLQLMLGLLGEDLSAGNFDLDDAREQVRRAELQISGLSRLAGDLLDLSRLDAGTPLRSEPVEVVATCRTVLTEFAARAREGERRIDLVAPRECRAHGDPSAIARIIRILVDNALRFTPPGEAVIVTVAEGGGEVTLSVEDRGPGVPAEERDLVFERFRRGSVTGGEGGFGLGLAIGRELARRMGGDLVLAGDGPGATLRLTLAAAQAG